MAQNETVSRRLENEAFLTIERNKALAAKTAGQPHNTARSYALKQAQWQVSIVSFIHLYLYTIYFILICLIEILRRTRLRRRGSRHPGQARRLAEH